MKHNFKFEIGQTVIVLDYDVPRKEHHGIVTRQWLEAYRSNSDPDELEERYEVQVVCGKQDQLCEFLVSDLTDDEEGNYWFNKREEQMCEVSDLAEDREGMGEIDIYRDEE